MKKYDYNSNNPINTTYLSRVAYTIQIDKFIGTFVMSTYTNTGGLVSVKELFENMSLKEDIDYADFKFEEKTEVNECGDTIRLLAFWLTDPETGETKEFHNTTDWLFAYVVKFEILEFSRI